MKQFKPEAVATVENKPVMGFVIRKEDLTELERQINTFSKGQHILAIKEEGENLRIALFLYNPNPPADMLKGVQDSVEKVVHDKSSIQNYAEIDLDPSAVSFGASFGKPKPAGGPSKIERLKVDEDI